MMGNHWHSTADSTAAPRTIQLIALAAEILAVAEIGTATRPLSWWLGIGGICLRTARMGRATTHHR
jgi:hypothetical protein